MGHSPRRAGHRRKGDGSRPEHRPRDRAASLFVAAASGDSRPSTSGSLEYKSAEVPHEQQRFLWPLSHSTSPSWRTNRRPSLDGRIRTQDSAWVIGSSAVATGAERGSGPARWDDILAAMTQRRWHGRGDTGPVHPEVAPRSKRSSPRPRSHAAKTVARTSSGSGQRRAQAARDRSRSQIPRRARRQGRVPLRPSGLLQFDRGARRLSSWALAFSAAALSTPSSTAWGRRRRGPWLPSDRAK